MNRQMPRIDVDQSVNEEEQLTLASLFSRALSVAAAAAAGE